MSKDEYPREAFPGGDVAPGEGELRVSIDRKVYADILSHAKEDPDVELCGVLLGRVKQDGRAPFLHIEGSVRGENAKGQGAQVTFTHETWNHIYKEQDKTSPRLDIVGWYHTHPGFDIFLSEHDRFIHSNFFSNPNQVAYVYDPQQGTEGFFRQGKNGLELLPRYWHGGKQRKIVPAEQRVKAASGSPAGGVGGDVAASLAALNESVRRLELEVHESREGSGGSIFLWIFLLLVILAFGTYQVFFKPPTRMIQFGTDPKTGAPLMIEVTEGPKPPPPQEAPPANEPPPQKAPEEKK